MKKILSFFVAFFLPVAAMAVDLPQILTDVDASLYQQIFALQDKEKINTAIKVQNQIADTGRNPRMRFFIRSTQHI